MKEELYQWMKNLAVFYIVFTAALHLLPEEKYERYVRFFMGLLLIFLLCVPVWSFFGKGKEMAEKFDSFYQEEEELRQKQELENLQQMYLTKAYEKEIQERILETLQNKGIEVKGAAVHIEGEQLTAVFYVTEQFSMDQERRLADELMETYGIREEEYEIRAFQDDRTAMDGSASSGNAAGSHSSSRVP